MTLSLMFWWRCTVKVEFINSLELIFTFLHVSCSKNAQFSSSIALNTWNSFERQWKVKILHILHNFHSPIDLFIDRWFFYTFILRISRFVYIEFHNETNNFVFFRNPPVFHHEPSHAQLCFTTILSRHKF